MTKSQIFQMIKNEYLDFGVLSDSALQSLWDDFCVETWGMQPLSIATKDVKPFILWATSSPLDYAKRGDK